MSDLTDEQIREEDRFLKGLPRVNVAALLMPPIWGPAHGFWVTILYYPAWLVADNLFYSAYIEPNVFSIILTILVFLGLLAITVIFSIVSQPIAAHRAQDKGQTREQYLKRQRYWAIAMAVLAVIMIGLATYYNLEIRPTVEIVE